MSWAETKILEDKIDKLETEIAELKNKSGSVIKSIQYGTVTISGNQTVGTTTISPVNPDKSILLYLGSTEGGELNVNNYGTMSGIWDMRITLKNSTTVQAYRMLVPSNWAAISTANFCVVEFN